MQQISAAKGKFIGSVERYDNSDQSKFPVFRSALMRACGKMSCSGEVLGIMKEHVADDGCMLLPPSVISDQAYLEKFKQHWCLPCVGADLVQRKTSASKCANEIVDLLVHEIVLANLTLICGSPLAGLLPTQKIII